MFLPRNSVLVALVLLLGFAGCETVQQKATEGTERTVTVPTPRVEYSGQEYGPAAAHARMEAERIRTKAIPGAQLNINLGTTANDHTGLDLRSFAGRTQTNFTELYGNLSSLSNTVAGLGSAAGKLNTNNDTAYLLGIGDGTAKRGLALNSTNKVISRDGPLDMLLFGAAADGSTDDTTVFSTAKTLAGTNGVVYFTARSTGSATTYYFSGTLDLTGCRIAADSGVVLNVGNSIGIDYRSILATTDITITNRAKLKQYVLPKNTGVFALHEKNVPSASYSSLSYLTFAGDFTAGQMGFASATPSAPGVAFTTTTNVSTIETASVATTNYLGHWIRPRVGRLVEMTFSTIAAQSSGHAQAVILDSVGTAYVGVEVIDADNGLKTYSHQVSTVSMTNGVRTRTPISVRNETWELGKNASQGRSVLVGVKMLTPNTAQFFVNHVLMGTLSLGNNCDRIFFAMNGAYSGALNGFYDPVAYEDSTTGKQRTLSVATFGDSVTAGSHTTLPWPEQLERDLAGQEGIGRVNVTNYGHSGDTAGDQVTVMGGVTLSAFTDVVVLIGINDISQAVLRSTFEANISYLIATPLAAGCNVVVAIPPMFDDGTANRVRGLIRGIVQRVAATKQGTGVGTVRVADNLNLIGDQIDNDGVGDLVHPNVDGNRIHSQAVAREIAKIYQAINPPNLPAVRRENSSLVIYGTTPPTTGYFEVGAMMINSAPSVGSWRGWQVTTAGAPGTWTGFGKIGEITAGDFTTSGATGTLSASGVAANTYGDASHVSQVTYDAKGRATSASSVAISLDAAAIASGTLAAARIPTGLGITNNGATLSNNIVAGSNITITAGANGAITVASSGGSGSQTPWTSDINGGGFSLTNAGAISSGSSSAGSLTLGDGGSHAYRVAPQTMTTNINRIPAAAPFNGIPKYAVTGTTNQTESAAVAGTDYQAPFTTGLGITNIANVISNNIVAGANMTITAGANGQLSLASSAGITTGLGLTNVGGITSNNIVAGANMTITAGANGQLSLAASGGSATPTDVQVFNSSGTWTMPAGAKWVRVICIGSGGGGGSGRRGPSLTAQGGGGGGSGAAWSELGFYPSQLSSPVTVTVGAGGTGGAAITADTTNGADGGNGTNTTFGTYLLAGYGGAGRGGTSAAGGTVQGGNRGLGLYIGGLAGVGSAGAASGSQPAVNNNGNTYAAAAGGGGGGVNADGSTTYAGGAGGTSSGALASNSGGAGGTAPGGTAAGSNGTDATGYLGGSGGGGGGARTATASGAGGNGGLYGAGGGGGAASLNGNNSGAGGNGGNGVCVVVTYF